MFLDRLYSKNPLVCKQISSPVLENSLKIILTLMNWKHAYVKQKWRDKNWSVCVRVSWLLFSHYYWNLLLFCKPKLAKHIRVSKHTIDNTESTFSFVYCFRGIVLLIVSDNHTCTQLYPRHWSLQTLKKDRLASRYLCTANYLTVSECHGCPRKVFCVEEVERWLARDLSGEVARHGGDAVVAVDDPAVGEVSGQVLVLDGLDQAQFSDRPKYNNYSLCPCVPL